MPTHPETEYAWAAGFFDGEGSSICDSILQTRGSFGHALTLIAGQAGDNGIPEELLRLQKLFGGSIRARKPQPGWKQPYVWRVTTKAARSALWAMWPYLSATKKEQADKARTRAADRRDLGQGWERERREHRKKEVTAP